jgi:hypothetical protein
LDGGVKLHDQPKLWKSAMMQIYFDLVDDDEAFPSITKKKATQPEQVSDTQSVAPTQNMASKRAGLT